MHGLYLFCGRARHLQYNIDYLDIDPHYGEIVSDALAYDLTGPQHQDFCYGGRRVNNDGHNQGGSNVHVVVEKWLRFIGV